MTYEEREQLREKYKKERIKRVNLTANKKDIYGREDMLNLPRHQVNCPNFLECPIDYKCRNYNPSYMACVHCKLHETDGICKKEELHTEPIFAMMISRERINLDGDEDEKSNRNTLHLS